VLGIDGGADVEVVRVVGSGPGHEHTRAARGQRRTVDARFDESDLTGDAVSVTAAGQAQTSGTRFEPSV
jgi:hypothetical protein